MAAKAYTQTISSHVVILLLLSTFITLSYPSPDVTFIYGGCSEIKFDDGSAYESKLNSLLASLLNSANFAPYNHFSLTSPSVSALYQCRGDVSTADCFSCVRSAVAELPHYCYHSSAGTLQYSTCYVRYGNDSFLGQPDRTFVLKKCGSNSGRTDSDLLSRRDEVLSGLSSSTGCYRSGNVGYVSGMAQCVGDLGATDCSDCVADAVERLRAGCGPTSWGDVYLAKCFVRYSAGGIYLSSGGSLTLRFRDGFGAAPLLLLGWVW